MFYCIKFSQCSDGKDKNYVNIQTIDLEGNIYDADDIHYVNICNRLRT